ncbi:MAG TPA: FxLYD domain-containing protein [Bryobacteraceae bacterium]|nr:FxLYD domain-containing protein [Bryobacteraceae bacterium]
MLKRLQRWLESIVFAGLKPDAPAGPPKSRKWLGPLRLPIERLLSGGGAPSDPLYLSNRTLAQKWRLALLAGVPCLTLLVLFILALTNGFHANHTQEQRIVQPAEMTSQAAPAAPKNPPIPSTRDVEVVDVHIDFAGGPKVAGTIRNNTAHPIRVVDLAFAMTDSHGSQVGNITGRVENLPPHARVPFAFPVKQRDAVLALVRSVTTEQ